MSTWWVHMSILLASKLGSIRISFSSWALGRLVSRSIKQLLVWQTLHTKHLVDLTPRYPPRCILSSKNNCCTGCSIKKLNHLSKQKPQTRHIWPLVSTGCSMVWNSRVTLVYQTSSSLDSTWPVTHGTTEPLPHGSTPCHTNLYKSGCIQNTERDFPWLSRTIYVHFLCLSRTV